jgi:hypothetical protein
MWCPGRAFNGTSIAEWQNPNDIRADTPMQDTLKIQDRELGGSGSPFAFGGI